MSLRDVDLFDLAILSDRVAFFTADRVEEAWRRHCCMLDVGPSIGFAPVEHLLFLGLRVVVAPTLGL